MISPGKTGISGVANNIAFFNHLPAVHSETSEMGVHGKKTIPMANDKSSPVGVREIGFFILTVNMLAVEPL